MPRGNKRVRAANFRKLTQYSDESIEKFVERLREAAFGCEFSNIDHELIRDMSRETITLTPSHSKATHQNQNIQASSIKSMTMMRLRSKTTLKTYSR
jgi:hypothetical protein